ncbi:MAG: DNA repair protein RecN [Lachnospiraceae bacterium]|jgi:DNA repair protein RecN (Recombination protein N)|nr:DNA repair protein RecN [Lachnospiraceae bacterium]
MLISLHVKNLALIAETEVNFGEGLNILSGETGAGKSILIGSINLALGARADKDMIRTGAEYALVELVFQAPDDALRKEIEALEIPIEEDGIIIIQRKIQPSRNVFKICGETVTAKQIKALSERLIDIHGQHEHQSLLYKKNHMEILDSFAGEELAAVKSEMKECYHQYAALKKELAEFCIDDGTKAKELSLAEFEFQEIEEAGLTEGEDEILEREYRRMANSRQIVEAADKVYQLTGNSDQSAADAVGYAVRELRSVESYDDKARELADALENIDALLNDFNREIAEYITDMEFDGEQFQQMEERLNLLNHLKLKYGSSIKVVLQYQEELGEKIERLNNADAYKAQLEAKLAEEQEKLKKLCQKASEIRSKEAEKLQKDMIVALTDLNFLDVKFEIQVREKEEMTAGGFDDVEFMISTNPGAPLKSLGNVASGGELSRIMLAIKTVLASRDKIPTMIFDEIDTGISGKTAWKVSEKLGQLSQSHQILCITHLPQIAAMADNHYKIAKQAIENKTVTDIVQLGEDEAVDELARMLGSDEITDTVRENAKELIATARKRK